MLYMTPGQLMMIVLGSLHTGESNGPPPPVVLVEKHQEATAQSGVSNHAEQTEPAGLCSPLAPCKCILGWGTVRPTGNLCVPPPDAASPMKHQGENSRDPQDQRRGLLSRCSLARTCHVRSFLAACLVSRKSWGDICRRNRRVASSSWGLWTPPAWPLCGRLGRLWAHQEQVQRATGPVSGRELFLAILQARIQLEASQLVTSLRTRRCDGSGLRAPLSPISGPSKAPRWRGGLDGFAASLDGNLESRRADASLGSRFERRIGG